MIVIAAVAVIAVAADLLANTASSGKKHTTGSAKAGTTTTPAKRTALKLVIGTVKVQNTGRPTKIKAPVRRAVLQAAQAYVDDAILAPLKSGRVDNGYEKVFGLSLTSAASGPDRAVLTEAKTGLANGPVRVTASRVGLDGIGDQAGTIALVATTFGVTVKAPMAAGPLTISRVIELTFEHQFGRWVVTSYNVVVRRTAGAKTASTRATSGGNGVAA